MIGRIDLGTSSRRNMRPHCKLCVALGLAVIGVPPLGHAQVLASERGSVSQIVDGTRIDVDYGRPRVRGRDSLFGKLEPFGRAWTPGADSATTLRVSKTVRILGRSVPPARYSVWLVPRARGDWTFVLDPRSALYHSTHPDSTAEQIRVGVVPRPVEHTEVLTWTFTSVLPTGTTLEMRWGTTAVSVPIEVTPTFPFIVSATDAAPYVGEYDYAEATSRGDQTPTPFSIQRRADGSLIGVQKGRDGAARETLLMPDGRDRFVQGIIIRGQLWYVADYARVVFLRNDGVVSGFEVRRDTVVTARATRRGP
jgi:hypothetical protein